MVELRKDIVIVGVLEVPFFGDSTEVPRGGETAIEVGLRHRQIGESRWKQQLPDIDRPQGLGTEARPGSECESRANAQQEYPGTWETMRAPPRHEARRYH